MPNPLVSYIIPSYNHCRYIEQAINSVLQQTYDNIELIIIDDGSTDETKQVLKQYQYNPKVYIVFNESNLGQSATLNKALRIAKGDFIGFLPSDDWLSVNKVELQVKLFLKSPSSVGVIYGKGARVFDSSSGERKVVNTEYEMLRGNLAVELIKRGNFIYPITPLFRKECFDDFPPDESYRAEGEAIYQKIALKYEFDYVDEVVGFMRDHPNNTGKMTDLMYEQNLRYLTEYFERTDLPPEVVSLKGYRIGKLKKIKAMEFIISRKQFKKGRKLLSEALVLDKSYFKDMKVMVALLLSILPAFVSRIIIDLIYTKKEKY